MQPERRNHVYAAISPVDLGSQLLNGSRRLPYGTRRAPLPIPNEQLESPIISGIGIETSVGGARLFSVGGRVVGKKRGGRCDGNLENLLLHL